MFEFKKIVLAALVSVSCGVVSPSWGQDAAPLPPLPPVPAALPPSRWPAQAITADGQVTIFQPQLSDFAGVHLTSRAAVSVQLNGQADPVFGAVWLDDRVNVDPESRTVTIVDVSVTQSRFPNPDPAVDRAVNDAVRRVFLSPPVTLGLDQVQSMLDTVHKEDAAAQQIQATAPSIVFRDHPAVKVQFDGPPRLVAVGATNTMRVVNTPFFVVLDAPTRSYFLKGGGRWFNAPDALGPYQQVGVVPGDIATLADASGYKDPQQPLNVDPNSAVEIITATDPTELVWSTGPAQYGIVSGTGLLYVVNSDSDVFRTIDTQQYFVLLSGRWYTAPRQDAAWTNVPADQLPADFHRIPANSDKADVLVSIPGTPAAQAALADAYVPQTAAVDMHQFEQPPVAYDGDARFEPVEGTNLQYAVNTAASVVLVNGRYYTCYNAAWYAGASPAGPWDLALSVPPEIYTIPPSCPIYPVRYVYVYGRTGDAVYYGYLPGYTGAFVRDGVVVYGTGYNYHPWEGGIYISRPATFGYAAHYDFYTRHWGFDFGLALGGGEDWIALNVAGPGHNRIHSNVVFGFGGFTPVYARDERHIEVGRARFVADIARPDHMTVNVYERRPDVRHELPGGGPGPREVSRPAVVRVEDRGRPAVVPVRPGDRPAVEPRPEDRRPEAPRPGEAPDRAAVDRAAADRAAADRAAAERGGADRPAADRAAADRTAADRAAAERGGGDRPAAERAAPDRAAADRPAADRGGADRAAADKAAADRAAADRAAADRAAADRAAADRAGADRGGANRGGRAGAPSDQPAQPPAQDPNQRGGNGGGRRGQQQQPGQPQPGQATPGQ
jgi:hypothetical protein